MLPRPFHIALQSQRKPQSYRYLKTCTELAVRFCRQPPPPLIFGGPRDTIFMQMLSSFAEVAKYGYYIYVVKI